MKSPADCTTLGEMRHAIDSLDAIIIEPLGQRFQAVQASSHGKKGWLARQTAVCDAAVIDLRCSWAATAGRNADVVEPIYRTLITHFMANASKLVEGVE